jgi:2-amino-4-hydroxy-6-hydroxymethyldihydropteridine diphosphokinase
MNNTLHTEDVLLSLGSNLGDRLAYLENAVELLQRFNVLQNIVISSVYETEPVGVTDQPWFLNLVIAGRTALKADELFLLCKSIEHSLGRKPRQRWFEREIDIDILLYGSLLINTDDLVIPHPRMHERLFVLKPAAEIAANIFHPTLNIRIIDLLINCNDTATVNYYEQPKISYSK